MPTFIKDKNTTNKMMFHILIALVPIIVFSFYKNGVMPYLKGFANVYEMFYPLIFLSVSTFSTFLFETIYQIIFSKDKNIKNIIFNSYSYLSGLFLGLILPINVPLSIVFLGGILTGIVDKVFLGVFKRKIFNPALLGKLIIVTLFATIITKSGGYLNLMETNTISSSINDSLGIGTYNDLVAPYGNLWRFFIGTIPGPVGGTSALLCIIAFIYLTMTKTIKWRIPVCYVGTVFLISIVIALYNDLGIWYPMFQILSGGLMFGAVFIAADPIISPITKFGQFIYGIFLGFVTILFRNFITYSEVILISILIMNMLIPLLDLMGALIRLKKI